MVTIDPSQVAEEDTGVTPQLEDRIMFITGANYGIGAATAKAFATQEAQVFITSYGDPCRYLENGRPRRVAPTGIVFVPGVPRDMLTTQQSWPRPGKPAYAPLPVLPSYVIISLSRIMRHQS